MWRAGDSEQPADAAITEKAAAAATDVGKAKKTKAPKSRPY